MQIISNNSMLLYIPNKHLLIRLGRYIYIHSNIGSCVKGSHHEFILMVNVLILVIIYSTRSGKRQLNILSRYISIRQAILYIRIKYNMNNTNRILGIIGLGLCVGLVCRVSSYINVKNKCRNMILYRKQVELSDYLHYIISVSK